MSAQRAGETPESAPRVVDDPGVPAIPDETVGSIVPRLGAHYSRYTDVKHERAPQTGIEANDQPNISYSPVQQELLWEIYTLLDGTLLDYSGIDHHIELTDRLLARIRKDADLADMLGTLEARLPVRHLVAAALTDAMTESPEAVDEIELAGEVCYILNLANSSALRQLSGDLNMLQLVSQQKLGLGTVRERETTPIPRGVPSMRTSELISVDAAVDVGLSLDPEQPSDPESSHVSSDPYPSHPPLAQSSDSWNGNGTEILSGARMTTDRHAAITQRENEEHLRVELATAANTLADEWYLGEPLQYNALRDELSRTGTTMEDAIQAIMFSSGRLDLTVEEVATALQALH